MSRDQTTGSGSPAAAASVRLGWLDGVKGISILWIAFFHFFGAWQAGRFPGPLGESYLARFFAACTPQSVAGTVVCSVEALVAAVPQLGFHAVAVFLLMSGFGLSFSLAKTGEPAGGWRRWYRSRLVRLFPMYWVAHIVYLVAPFQSRPEPIDYRFLLSFLGDRIWPVYSMFYYFNPALWYFGLLLELYLVFPVLFRMLQRLGVTGFLAAAALLTFGSRYVLLCVWPVHGFYVQGAFFLPRLWEFALGMALGAVCRRDSQGLQRRLFSPFTLLAGAALYTLGLYSYGTLVTYVFTDALIGTGLFVILAHLARGIERVPGLGAGAATVGVYSYGLYLLHQPFVLDVGYRVQGLSTLPFVVFAALMLAGLTAASMAIEKRVNALAERVLG